MKTILIVVLALVSLNLFAKPAKRSSSAKRATPLLVTLPACPAGKESVNDPEDPTCAPELKGKTTDPASCSKKCLRVCVDRKPASAPEGMTK